MDWFTIFIISITMGIMSLVLNVLIFPGAFIYACYIIMVPFYYPPYLFCKAVAYCFTKMKTCLGADEIHDIESGTLPTTTPPQPQAAQPQKQRKVSVACYQVFHYQKDVEVGFPSEECVICLGEFEEEDECAMLKKCKHTYHRECIDKVKEDSCPLCRRSIEVKIEKP